MFLDAHSARDIGLPDVLVVELIAALRAEFGRMLGVFRLPAALVTAVQRLGRGLLRAAFGAELALVDRAAGADPAVGGLGSAALHTEFARIHRAAGAFPSVCTGRGCSGGGRSGSSGLLLTHLEQRAGVETTGGLRHVHAHEAHHRTVFVSGGGLHCLGLRLYHVRRCHVGVAENGGLLQLLDGGLVLGGGGHGVDAHGDDGEAPCCAPLAGQNFVHGLRQLHGPHRCNSNA